MHGLRTKAILANLTIPFTELQASALPPLLKNRILHSCIQMRAMIANVNSFYKGQHPGTARTNKSGPWALIEVALPAELRMYPLKRGLCSSPCSCSDIAGLAC